MNTMTSATTYTGHGENTGGLQQHSMGDTYPLTVVGLDEYDTYLGIPTRTMWYLKNLATGKVLARRNDYLLRPLLLSDVHVAHNAAFVLRNKRFAPAMLHEEPYSAAVRAGIVQYLLRIEDATEWVELERY